MSNLSIQWSDVSFDGNAVNSTNIAAIQDALHNIISTSPGERLFNPEFGCAIEDLLFEPCDENTAFMILTTISDCISRWDVRFRVNLARTEITPDPENNAFRVLLVVDIVSYADTVTFDFSLNRPI